GGTADKDIFDIGKNFGVSGYGIYIGNRVDDRIKTERDDRLAQELLIGTISIQHLHPGHVRDGPLVCSPADPDDPVPGVHTSLGDPASNFSRCAENDDLFFSLIHLLVLIASSF